MNLKKLIKNGENKRVEFKERVPKNESIVKTVISFSNTSGGKLIIGVTDNREILGIDEEENFNYSLNEFDLTLIYKEFKKIGKSCDFEKLKNMKLIKELNGKFMVTNALAIIFGRFDNVMIKCARFKGTTMETFIDKKEFKGNLFEILDNSIKFLQNHLHLNAKIEGMRRVEQYEIPLLALREIVLNAIIHRDYTRNSDIKIAIYDDIVEIISVGGFVNGLTIDEISNGRSELRNRVVANLFKELHFIESWGSGIGKVKDSCNKREIKFELVERGLFVEAVFYRPNIGKISDSIRKPSDSTDYDRIVPNKKETVVKPLLNRRIPSEKCRII